MFEFEVVQEIELNSEIQEIIEDSTFTVNNGKVKYLLKTSLQFIEPAFVLLQNTNCCPSQQAMNLYSRTNCNMEFAPHTPKK